MSDRTKRIIGICGLTVIVSGRFAFTAYPCGVLYAACVWTGALVFAACFIWCVSLIYPINPRK